MSEFNKFPYILGEPAEMLLNGEWVKGKICNGYRFRDGIVTIKTDDGNKVWCGVSRTDLYRPINNDIDDEKEDPDIYRHGITILWAAGSKVAINNMCRQLSKDCGVKVDWSYTGGRAHIDTMPDNVEIVMSFLNKNDTYLNQFICDYETDSNMYFEILK